MFSGTLLLFPWSSGCWQLDLWFLCLFENQLEHLEVQGSRIAEAWLGEFWAFFTSMWNECNCAIVWAFLAFPFFGIGMKTDLFQSCGHCWVFQICWHIECSTFTASSFRIIGKFSMVNKVQQSYGQKWSIFLLAYNILSILSLNSFKTNLNLFGLSSVYTSGLHKDI